MASLLTSGIGTVPGGSLTGSVTVNTTGANFLFVAASFGDNAAAVNVLTDSQSNVWTQIAGYPTVGDGHKSTENSCSFWWASAPSVSAAHVFTLTSSGTGNYATFIVSAFEGIDTPSPFNTQVWKPAGDSTTAVTTTLAGVSGLVFAVVELAFDFGTSPNAALGSLTASTGFILIGQQATDQSVFGHTGLNLAYQLIPSAATASATWGYPTMPGAGDVCAGLFAFTATVAPPPTPVTYPIRRLRRFMLPWDDASRVKFTSRLELVMQAGIGDATTTTPLVMLRFSKDGGKTWGSEILMNAGAMGEYSARVFVNRLPAARNPVVEITVSDPVDWQFVQCLVDMEEGLW